MKVPRRKQVRDETFRLLTENGLTGWRVRFNPRLTRALGRCIASQKTIEYQPAYMEQNDWEQVLGTIQHEVAHALTPRHGHDAVWAAKARELGLKNPSAINRTANLKRKFTGTCPGCKKTTQADRRGRYACSSCCNQFAGGLFSPAYAFVWTRND